MKNQVEWWVRKLTFVLNSFCCHYAVSLLDVNHSFRWEISSWHQLSRTDTWVQLSMLCTLSVKCYPHLIYFKNVYIHIYCSVLKLFLKLCGLWAKYWFSFVFWSFFCQEEAPASTNFYWHPTRIFDSMVSWQKSILCIFIWIPNLY